MATTSYISTGGVGEYTGSAQTHQYQTVTGLVAVPRANRTLQPKLVRVHAEYGQRVVRWQTGRNGRPPIVPTMSDLVGDRFLGGEVSLPMPTYDPITGGYNWRVSGEYVYLQARGRRPGVDPLLTGGYPHPVTPQDDAARFVSRGISPTPPQLAAAATPVEALFMALGAALIRHDTQFPWPFTTLPVESGSDTLIGG